MKAALTTIFLSEFSDTYLPFLVNDDLDTTSFWVELKRNLSDTGARFQGVRLAGDANKWNVKIEHEFSRNRNGEKWFIVVNLQPAGMPVTQYDTVAHLPAKVGLDQDYKANSITLNHNVQGEITINVDRVTPEELDAPDFLFYYNLAKQI